jgi:hypothetical protein
MDITAETRAYRSARRTRGERHARNSRGGIYSARRPDTRPTRGLSGLELAIIVALVAAVIAAAVLSGASAGGQPTRTSTIKVGAGESLWSIATAHPVQGMTTQQNVDAIRRANHLRGSTVAEGSVLRVPGAASGAVALAR